MTRLARLMVAVICTLVGVHAALADTSAARPKRKPSMDRGHLVAFDAAPYPFRGGKVPGDDQTQDKSFFEKDIDGRLFHVSPRGGKLFEHPAYDDNRSLLFMPPRFDPTAAGAFIFLFFHGNQATLTRDVMGRQRVPQQLIDSHQNAVLVAPQLAVDALDSSPGRFYDRGFFEKYLREASEKLAEQPGTRWKADDIDRLPVVIVAYSGGYLATAFSLHYALQADPSRIAGVILLDALFGEPKKFEDWLVDPRAKGAFFVSAYSKSSAPLNRGLEADLRDHGISVQMAVPGTIGPGDVVFRSAPNAVHLDFVTAAWTSDPLTDLLRRIRIDAGARGSR